MGEKSEVGEGKWKSLTQSEKSALIERFCGLMASRLRSPVHVAETRAMLLRLMEFSKWSMDEDSITLAVGELVKLGRSLRTCNKYIWAAKCLSRWLGKRGWLAENALADIPLFRAATDPRHERVAFSDDALERLLRTTAKSRYSYRGITGRERSELYHLAACSGLRAGTIAVLKAGQFELDGPLPMIRVRAAQLKDREDLSIPLHPTSAERLRRFLHGRDPAAIAFKTPPLRRHFIDMLRADLRAAQIVYCVERTLPNGQTHRTSVLDFHALRCTYGSWLAKNNVPLPTIARLMGHSTTLLTERYYVHVNVREAAAAVGKTPPMPGTF